MALYPETSRTMLEKVIAGDEIGWENFFRTYAPVIRTLCKISNLNGADAEDVVQEVMSQFARQRGKFRYQPEKARFHTYFSCLVRGAIANVFRNAAKAARIQSIPEDLLTNDTRWDAQFDEVWRENTLQEALHKLASHVSSRNYLAFTMSTLQGHSVKETAEFLHISAPQIYLVRNRCTGLLRDIIRRCNDADPELNLSLPEK